MLKSAWDAICQFVLGVRSTMGEINGWLLSHHWTLEIYAVIGIVLLMFVCLYQKFPRRWYIQLGILLVASLLCLCIFALVPLLVLVRVTVVFVLLLGLFHVGFRQKAAQYQRPNQEEDFLGRRLFYKKGVHQIRQMLQRHWDDIGLTIAVYGPWGSGKSHFLRYLERNLSVVETESDVTPSHGFNGKCVIAKVDLWQCHSLEEAWEEIAVALCESITGKRSYVSHTRVANALLKGVSAINENLTPFVYVMRNFLYGGEDYQSSVAAVNKMLRKRQNEAAVLFLDNVERCNMEIIMQLLPLLERLKQIHHLVVVAAIAKEELEKKFISHGYKEEYLYGVLYKLFDNTMTLPESRSINLGEMFKNMAKRYHNDCPTLMKYIEKHHTFPCSTPRAVERLVNHLAYIDNQYLARFSNCLQNEDWIKRCDCVFQMENVRLNHSRCYQYLMETPDVWYFLKHVPYGILTPDWNRMSWAIRNQEKKLSEKNGLWENDNKEFISFIENDATAKSYLYYFSQQEEEDFKYALNMSYFYLDELGDIECDEMIELSVNGKNLGIRTIPEAVERLYGDCQNIEKKQIIIQSVMRAVQKTKDRTAREFVFLAFRTCYETIAGMNYSKFYPFLICNIAEDDKWNHVEKLVLSKLSYSQIADVLMEAFALLHIHEDEAISDAYNQEYARSLRNNFSLLKELCCKYMSALLKSIAEMQEVPERRQFVCDVDFESRGMPYYESVIRSETLKAFENLNKIDVLKRLFNSLYYWQKAPFTAERNKKLLFTETYFKIIVCIMKAAGLLYEDIQKDEKLVAQVKGEVLNLMDSIGDYNNGYEGHKTTDEIVLSYISAGKLAQEFFSEYLNKIEQAEQAAQETLAAQDDT